MRNTRRAGILAVAATAALLVGSQAAGATDDLDCGDPGTSPNMTVEPGDPHGLDRDHDGIGCEEPGEPGPSVPEPSTPPAPEPTEPPAPDVTEPPAPEPQAAPAQPVERQPTYTG